MSGRSIRRVTVLAILLLASAALPSHAQPAGERLIVPIPPTFKLAGQIPHDGATIEVFVPANETMENWSEQIATQVRFNMAARTDLVALLHVVEQIWMDDCKESPPITILPVKTNGYATATMLMQCPRLASTGKPEGSLFHAIKGTDNLYLVQKNTRTVLDRDKIKEMVRYMGTVTVCDSRTPEHPCLAK